MARGLRKNGGFEGEKWEGQVNNAVTRNWTNVIKRPTDVLFSMLGFGTLSS